MARGKKKSKAQHESEEDERSSNAGGEVAPQPKPEGIDSGKDEKSDAGSNAGSDDSEERARKNKEKRKAELLARKNKKRGGKADKKQGAKGSGGDNNGSDNEGEIEVTRQRAVEALYCPICTFPAEMCDFSGMMDKCRPWLLEHAAELANAEDRGRRRRILTEKERLEAMMEGRGIKKALERIILLDVEKRTGHRMITSVYGMDLFGFNLKDLSRDWRKSFACGAGVRAPEEGKHQDCVDIQGSVADQLAELLVKKYSIPKDAIYIMENKKKQKYFDE